MYDNRDDVKNRWVSFRVNQSEADMIESRVREARLNRSKLLRSAVASGGIIYVGNTLIKSLADYRADTARVGNLIKMTANYLEMLYQHPQLSDADRESIDNTLGELDDAGKLLLRNRMDLVKALEKLDKELTELNNGNI